MKKTKILLLHKSQYILLSFKFESISEEEISQDEEFSDDDFYYDSEEHVVECSSDCAGMTHGYLVCIPPKCEDIDI